LYILVADYFFHFGGITVYVDTIKPWSHDAFLYKSLQYQDFF